MKNESKGLLALFSEDIKSSKPIWSSDCDDNIISLFSVVKDFIGIKDIKDFKDDKRELINEPEFDGDE